MSAVQDRRRAMLQRVVDLYSVDTADREPDCEESLIPYFDGEQPIGKWCAITTHEDTRYAYPAYDTREAAQSRALHYIGDSMFEEMPRAVVSLDSGLSYEPEFWRTPWSSRSKVELEPTA